MSKAQELEQLLQAMRKSQRRFTPAEARRVRGYQHRLIWRKLERAYEKLETQGRLEAAGHVAPQEAAARLKRCLKRLDEIKHSHGFNVTWLPAVLETVRAMDITKRASLLHLESALRGEATSVKKVLQHDATTQLYELLQLLQPQGTPEEFLMVHEVHMADRGLWNAHEALELLTQLTEKLHLQARAQEAQGLDPQDEMLHFNNGRESLDLLLLELEHVESTVICELLVREALESPECTLKDILKLISFLSEGVFSPREQEIPRAEASRDHVALALSALRQAGGLEAVGRFLSVYDPWDYLRDDARHPGVDVALTFALHYKDLKDQPHAVWVAMTPSTETLREQLYGAIEEVGA